MRSQLFVFLLIVLVAAAVRLYSLGSLPNGLTWDEAAIGYNAYGLVTNHRDEWLKRTPIVFQSFGDYKSPLLVYVTALFVAVLQLTPFAVRLPIALTGIAVVILTFFLMKEILRLFDEDAFSKQSRKWIPFVVMWFVAISPWAVHYSRIGFESTLAVFFVSLGVYGWLRGRREGVWLLIGDVSFVLSLYAYHSSKVVVPLIAVLMGIFFYKDFLKQKKMTILGTCMAFLLLLPLGYATFFGNANKRAISTTIIGSPNVVMVFAKNFVEHLSPSFLLFGKDLNFRQGTKQLGVLHALELELFIIACVALMRNKKMRKMMWVPALFLIGLIPAALGIDVPHSNRALLAYPWIQISAGIGYIFIWEWVARRKKKYGTAILITGLLLSTGVNLARYEYTYSKTYQSSIALRDFGYGYEEAIAYARSQEGSVDTVFFTNDFGQAYIYLLFYKRLTPIEYQGGALANYSISDNPYKDTRGRANVLVIGTKDDFPPDIVSVKDILYPDGEIAFRIVKQ